MAINKNPATKNAVCCDMFHAYVDKSIFLGRKVKAVIQFSSPAKMGDAIHVQWMLVVVNVKNIAGS